MYSVVDNSLNSSSDNSLDISVDNSLDSSVDNSDVGKNGGYLMVFSLLFWFVLFVFWVVIIVNKSQVYFCSIFWDYLIKLI